MWNVSILYFCLCEFLEHKKSWYWNQAKNNSTENKIIMTQHGGQLWTLVWIIIMDTSVETTFVSTFVK